ncbi:MAG: histidine kinase [Lachnospiraceae bacterium]|nr:histidine kinase [Lachnospiraceae bacterium]
MKNRNGALFNRSVLFIYLLNSIILLYAITSLSFRPYEEHYNATPWLSFEILIIIACLLLFVVTFFLLIVPMQKVRKTFKGLSEQNDYSKSLKANEHIPAEINEYISELQTVLSEQNTGYQNKEAEFLALQTQINPHFLYNTLEAIRGDALEAKAASIAETTEALSVFFRYTITNTNHLVTLEDELEHVNNYFIIQQYRFLERLELVVYYPEDKETLLNLKIPKLILQPIIENAIFHGLENSAHGGVIGIYIEHTAKRLLITVTDNGIGISKDSVDRINERMQHTFIKENNQTGTHENGIALQNVARRIQLLFGLEYGIRLMSVEGAGTQVLFTLPKVTGH